MRSRIPSRRKTPRRKSSLLKTLSPQTWAIVSLTIRRLAAEASPA
jgi:hypothetical protein